MPKKLILLSLAFILATAIVLMAMPGERQKATPLTGGQSIRAPLSRAACTMVKHDGTAVNYFGSVGADMGFYTYFDPAVECAATPTYPFEITAFTFTLYDFAGVGTATVDIVVYDMAASGLICDGPGAEKCRTTVTVTTFYPNTVTYSFPTPCCVTGPFFIGVEYPNAVIGTTPSVLMDAALDTDTCTNWMRYTDGFYYEFWDFWSPPIPGEPLFWVDGETQSANCTQGPCTWQPGDPYKMHFPQLPDEAGWDVNATQPVALADDFQCTWTGPVKDIHFWGSWKHGVVGQIISFFVSISADIPASQSPTGYSMPGATLWEREVTNFGATPKDPPTSEGWYDPATGEIIYDDHQAYFQYDVCFDNPEDWFYQDSGTIYWLGISVIVADPTTTQWGWKSTQDHWNDDAVWGLWGELDWIDLWEPAQPLTNDFNIQIDPSGVLLEGGGTGAFGEGWFFYPEYEWWNIWFYDHPFAPERRKTGRIEFDLLPFVAGPTYFEIAVNWSTDIWSLEQPPADSSPPLPGVNEDDFIGRKSLFVTQSPEGHYVLPYEIPDYNPEWVSVDVRGYNFVIPVGFIQHICQGSLDLSFVITGKEEQPVDSGACCYDPTGGNQDAACIYTTQTHCEQTLMGVYEGDGVQCTAPQACCLPDGSCIMADPLCCTNELGGTPQGAGSSCTQVQACCFTDGSCAMLDPLCCVDQGGTVSPYSAVCLGDNNQNGTDDACEEQPADSGACCYDPTGGNNDAACIYTTQTYCEQGLGGVYQGTGVPCTAPEACCLPDGSCIMADPLCCTNELGGTPQGAGSTCTQPQGCCMPDGSCQMLDPLCCDDQGGTPQGTGTTCAGMVACCMPDGTCKTVSRICCDDLGGTPSPFGAPRCLGDLDGDGSDDACVIRQGLKWRQEPDLEITGLDVDASCPGFSGECVVAADDFLCTDSGPITEIHIYCSWLHDQYPGDPGQVRFILSIHDDVPAGVDLPWSHPGGTLWMQSFDIGGFMFRPYALDILEGYYDPVQGYYEPDGDFSCWEYIFVIPEELRFVQRGTEQEPVVYWLDVQAYPESPGAGFLGWKTSLNHWNDDAVWALGIEPEIPPDVWQELRYPPGSPLGSESIDLAFEIYGGAGPCDCTPGDANNDGAINIGDAVYIINYIFKSGPAPIPYALCSGDANCDCAVNIADAVYLINYIFKSGPPPCDCLTWLSICGPPLRK